MSECYSSGSSSNECEERVHKKSNRHRSSSGSPTRMNRNKSKKHKRKHKHRDGDSRSRSPHRPRIKSDPDDGIKREHSQHRGRNNRHRDRRAHHQEHPDFDPYRPIKRERDEDVESQRRERRQNDERREARRRRGDNPFNAGERNNELEFGREEGNSATQPVNKEKPSFELSGKLAEDTNTYKGVVIKYNEPPEARKPKKRWRLYPFKGDEALPVLYVHRQSAFLMGRDRIVADIPVDHPSCSKQHAVLQFRLVDYTREDGSTGRQVRPYIIDLESSNGTYVNNKRIEPSCYVQLMEKDVLKFGFSTREYVMLHEKTKTVEADEGESD